MAVSGEIKRLLMFGQMALSSLQLTHPSGAAHTNRQTHCANGEVRGLYASWLHVTFV
jgi:hypothetical protein